VKALCRRIRQGLPDADPRCRSLPEDLERVIRSGLAALPEQRPSLHEFVTAVRGSLNQLLADTLTLLPTAGANRSRVDLRLMVSRARDGGTFEPVATSHPQPGQLVRDLQRVPRPPDQLRLQTGERVRLEVATAPSPP